MNLLDVFRRNSGAIDIADRAEVISRYKRLRVAGSNLNDKLVRRLSNDVLHEGGKKLGILQRGTLVFNTEDETSVLMDYCLHNVRRKGRNAIEQYLIESPPDPESDEMVYLRAAQHSIYSLFLVETVERGLGVTVQDLLSSESAIVVDMGFSRSAEPGLVLASRLLSQDGFSMTGGAALPIAVLPADQRDAMRKDFSEVPAPDDGDDFDPAPIIRKCLSMGCSSQVQYQEPTGRLVGRRRAPEGSSSATVGRNAPCPCGSGRKFKKCCLRKSGG